MIDAFDKRANFTGISKKPLHLDELYMSTFFSVNEFGSTGDASNSKYLYFAIFYTIYMELKLFFKITIFITFIV